MNDIKIKNCGLSSRIEVDMAVNSGAHFVGFVHYEPSSRHVSLEAAQHLALHCELHVERVLVTVNPNDALLRAISNLNAISHLQVHAVRDAARLYQIRGLSHKELIVGVDIATRDDVYAALELEDYASHVLLDSKSSGHGGSGASFDWTLLDGAHFKKPWFLAGGLTRENVIEAIARTHAPMVDVSSGIEASPGKKSLEKIATFNARVLEAAHEHFSV